MKMIDGDHLLKELVEDINIPGASLARVREHLNNAEGIELVRCMNCRYFEPYKKDRYSRGDCNNLYGATGSVCPIDYCSRGERRKGE